METGSLDLSLSAVVNAAGALLFVLGGLGILALSGRRTRGLLVGGLAVAFGVTFVAYNVLVSSDTNGIRSWALTLSGLVATIFALALAREEVRGVPTPTAVGLATFAVVVAIPIGVVIFHYTVDPAGIYTTPGEPIERTLSRLATVVEPVALLILLVAQAARLHHLPKEAHTARRATAFFALAFGLFTLALAMRNATLPRTGGTVPAVVASGILAILAAAAFIPTPRMAEPRISRVVSRALLVAGFAGLALVLAMRPPYTNEYGFFGVVRTIGAVLLAIAVLKYDLLGVPLPQIVVHRGALAAGALATLFIVAQVAQNFLAAQYGLLMGGIVAGAFLFAAAPLQRAMEGVAAPRSARGASVAPERADDRSEAIYREALRFALADGDVSRDEDLHLTELGEHLGISARRAREMRLEIEADVARGAR